MPEVLYHYTNIESLALILKNRTIRLNPLNKMDDIEENLTADIENAGMFTYVSCWTNNKRESIALWKQYTIHDTGVRIELRKNPFKRYNVRDMLKEIPNVVVQGDGDLSSFIRLDTMLKSDYFTQSIMYDSILYEVEYTEDESKIIPQLISSDSAIAVGKIGIYKRYDWNYQQEWRYKLQFLPGNLQQISSDAMHFFLKKLFTDIVNGKMKQPLPYYDLEIDEHSFSEMKIVLSPTISPGNEILIKTAIEKYNPRAVVSESVFKGKIR